MKNCILEIIDEVNIKFNGLDASLRRQMKNSTKHFLPSARFQPSYKLGRWDGNICFFEISGKSYYHLLPDLLPQVIEAGYTIELVDHRKNYEIVFPEITAESYSHIHWPKGHVCEGEPIVLREHQVDYINSFLKHDDTAGVSVAPTGGGKTICTAIMSDCIGKYGRSIVIVPTKDLVVQTERDYKLLGLDVGVFYGDRKEYDKQHTICTWQSLESLRKNSKNKEKQLKLEQTITEFTNNVKGIIIDEAHKASANVLKDLSCRIFSNVPIRWGLTGTIPKDKIDQINVRISLGNIIGVIKSRELQDKGVLAELDITINKLQDDINYTKYHEEMAYLLKDQKRLSFIAEEIYKYSENGNTLVLVNFVETGKILEELIPDSVFLHGSNSQKERAEEYTNINEGTNKIVIATYGIASTGIDIPRIFNLVLLEPGKSFVRVIQSIGRAIRIAKDKKCANIYDFASNCKFSSRHLRARKKYYREHEYPFKEKRIKWK